MACGWAVGRWCDEKTEEGGVERGFRTRMGMSAVNRALAMEAGRDADFEVLYSCMDTRVGNLWSHEDGISRVLEVGSVVASADEYLARFRKIHTIGRNKLGALTGEPKGPSGPANDSGWYPSGVQI